MPSKTRLRAASHSKKRVLPTNGQLKDLRSYSNVRLVKKFTLKNIPLLDILGNMNNFENPKHFLSFFTFFQNYTTKFETFEIHNFIWKHEPFIITWTFFEFVIFFEKGNIFWTFRTILEMGFFELINYLEFANISLKQEYFSYLHTFLKRIFLENLKQLWKTQRKNGRFF